MKVNVQSTAYKNVDDNDLKKIYSPYALQVVLAHEMTHVMQYNFNMPDYNNDGTPAYIDEGMADLTVGRFYVNAINSLAGNANSLNTALNNFGKIDGSLEYETGFLFWHYLMKQTADSSDKSDKNYSKPIFTGTLGDDNGYAGYVHTGDGSNYSLGGGNDTLYVYGNSVSVDGGAGDDYINNHTANVTITGGTGNDTVYMGGGWNNIFNYTIGDGNDTLFSFHEHDTLNLGTDTKFATLTSSADIVVSVEGGEILLKDAANRKSLNIVGSYDVPSTVKSDSTPTVKPDSTVIDDGGDSHNYASGNVTISNYQSWEEIKFGGTHQNWVVTGDDFVINAAEGSLRITNARDKLLEFKNSDGSVLAHVCMPSDDATFDGSTYNEFVVAVGANNHNNILIAGNAGSSLWGGDGDNSDNLFGGAGADAFIYHYGNGEDNIFNASSEDIVLLPDITLNEIHSVFENQNKVDIGFTDGGALNIDGKVSSYILRSNEYPAKPTPFSIEQLKRGVMEK